MRQWFRSWKEGINYDFSESIKIAVGAKEMQIVLKETMYLDQQKPIDFLHLGTYLFTLKDITVDYSEHMLTVKHYWKVSSKDGVDINTCTREQYNRLFRPLFNLLRNAD